MAQSTRSAAQAVVVARMVREELELARQRYVVVSKPDAERLGPMTWGELLRFLSAMTPATIRSYVERVDALP